MSRLAVYKHSTHFINSRKSYSSSKFVLIKTPKETNEMKTTMTLLFSIALFFTLNSQAKETVYPIEDVKVDQNKTGDTIIKADSVYPTPCFDVTSKTAVVNSFEETITLKQKSENTGQTYCNQVITPVTLRYNLGDVPKGRYEVIDSFDNTIIEEVIVKSADKTTVNNKIK